MNTNRGLTRFESPFFDLAKKFFNNDDFDFYPSFETRRNSGLSNISETDNEYVVEISAPGLKKEDIKIELENDILKISSDFEDQKEEKNDGYYRREFCRSSFERSFTLPKIVDKENISASMENGILSVSIPKLKEEKKKDSLKITIK